MFGDVMDSRRSISNNYECKKEEEVLYVISLAGAGK